MTPSATGTLAATPLAHALVYARNRRLTGRLELTVQPGDPESASAAKNATITLWRGSITFVETQPIGLCPGGFFGAVVYELGFIDSAMLDATLLEIAKTKRLHGEVLLARKAITVAQRDEALVEQIHRKVHHLFSFPETTTYAFYDAQPVTDPPVAVECVGPVWRGIRDYPPKRFVEETMKRVGDHALRATTGGAARLPPTEAALTQLLAAQAMTLSEMKAATELPPARVELLVYLLVIAKCVEAVSGVRTHPSTGALPASMPSGPMKIPSGLTSQPSVTSVTMPAASSSGQIPAASGSSRPGGTASSGRLPAASASSGRIPIMPASGSSGRLPVVPGSSPRIPAATGSSPRIPAAAGSVRPAPAGSLAALRTPAEYGVDGILARALSIEEESFFEVLGVLDGASTEAVRAAFMRLAKSWHPDRTPPDFMPIRGEIAKIFGRMALAHKTLSHPESRREYVDARTAKTEARPRADVLRDVETAFATRQFALVMSLCDPLILDDSDDTEAIAFHTWASVRAGEAPEDELRAALTRLDRAVNVDRTCDQAIYHRGMVHKLLGNPPSAIRDFARAVQLNPKHVAAERELRIFAMRVRKGSGEHKLIAPILDKLEKK
jgi:hypothetical protein